MYGHNNIYQGPLFYDLGGLWRLWCNANMKHPELMTRHATFAPCVQI
jgi:hypothetical protein